MFTMRTLFLALSAAVWLTAADPAWRAKPISQWTEQDANQILTQSPWAREIRAGVARRESEDELRNAGQMGQRKGVGYEGVDPKESLPRGPKNVFTPDNSHSARSQNQSMMLRIRWESALPMRAAELKAREVDPPTLEGDGYKIAVYGLPGGYFKGDPKRLGDPLKKDAALKREGKADVKPSSVEVFVRADGIAVVYLFPLSAELTKKDMQVVFEAHIGRITVSQAFELAEMEYLGKLEL